MKHDPPAPGKGTGRISPDQAFIPMIGSKVESAATPGAPAQSFDPVLMLWYIANACLSIAVEQTG